MDPLSIAASATGLAVTAAKLSSVLYSWVDETRNVDTNVSGFCEEILSLSRLLEAIGRSIKENPVINAPGLDQDNELWSNFNLTLDDCHTTLDKLGQKLEEVQNSTLFGLSILRRPVKQIRLSLKMKEIEVYRQRIQYYNGALQLPLQMINVSVLLQNRAGQQNTDSKIAGLREQVGRVERALRHRHDPQINADDLRDENDRFIQNLMKLVRQADKFQSKASSISGTIYGGSVSGDAMSRDQWVSIENWIPPPIIEEPEHGNRDRDHLSTATTLSSGEPSSTALRSPGSFSIDVPTNLSGSDSDSEIEREMTKKFKELALGSFQRQEYEKAEKLLSKVIHRLSRASRDNSPMDPDLRPFEVRLAMVHCLQGKWRKAENILLPMATRREETNVEAFHGMHVLALRYMMVNDHTIAVKYCKRAMTGKRRILGKDHVSLYQSIHLLAFIYERAGDPTEAEGYRSFLEDAFHEPPPEPEHDLSRYIEENFDLVRVALREDKVEAVSSLNASTFPEPTFEFEHKLSLNPESPLDLDKVTAEEGRVEFIADEVYPKPSDESEDIASQPSGSIFATPSKSWDTLLHGLRSSPLDIVQQRPQRLQQDTQGPQELTTALPHPHVLDAEQLQGSGRIAPELSYPESRAAMCFIGIDLGIVYTSVAIGFATETKISRHSIAEWSRPTHQNILRMPTILYYDRSGNVVGWGPDTSNALGPTGRPKDYLHKSEGFMLPGKTSCVTLSDEKSPPLPLGKSRTDVITDFLSNLRQAILDRLQSLGVIVDSHMISYTIATPALFNDTERAAVRAAATKAGYLCCPTHGTRFVIIKYSQATLLSLRSIGTLSPKHQHEGLMLYCGPAIVELSSYRMLKDSLLATEYSRAHGAACGFMLVEEYFLSHVRRRIGRIEFLQGTKVAFEVEERCMKDFSNRIKLDFNDDGRSWAIGLELEESLPIAGIEAGYMTFTNNDILSCFKPTLKRIRGMIRTQLGEIREWGNLEYKSIIICGEFSKSGYVFKYMEEHFTSIGVKARIIRETDTQIAVRAASGAVLAGSAINDWPFPPE